ncbi:uncharacterized protein LOC116413245 [Galleria mellonella]|uniref:Uncharacterized protein LOC116413245 n=1 Tax=Galleria mellonella TaxID=7137 RepID=A0A6J3C5D9_GALME|nr:uncharacterized protein LOC116413245 [Galleria mellonella]
MSRRGSSVYQGSTGGLMLQQESEDSWQNRGLEQEREYARFNRPELLITCCDYVCILTIKDREELGTILPPPGDTLRARRPSIWELPDDVLSAPVLSRGSPRSPPAVSPRFLAPSTAEYPTQDLDTLLENAGLQDILEKDFVLMQGLKHDLNRKLAEMESNMHSMASAVSVGAPYLALRTYDPDPMHPVDEMVDTYKRVMKLFPASSVGGTPTGSESTTPRNRTSRL